LHPSLAKTSSPPETSTPAVIVQSVKQGVADDQQEIIDVQQASPVDLTEMEIVPPEADLQCDHSVHLAPSLPEALVVEDALPLPSSPLCSKKSVVNVESLAFRGQHTVMKASTLHITDFE
jgi:hypothetical protein